MNSDYEDSIVNTRLGGTLEGGVKLAVSGTISTHAVHAKCAYGSSSVGLCQ